MRTTGGAGSFRHRLLFLIMANASMILLSLATDENGEIKPVLLRDNKCIKHDVKYWMPLPNVEYRPYRSEIVK